ncbi:MAG TPA: hypothetical protein VIV56_16595, partial [Gemmatimonadales bacterium]
MLRHPSLPHRLAAAVRVSHRLGLSAALASGALAATLLVANCNVAGRTGPPPVATQLAFKIDPATSPAGGTLPPVTVQARDASGNLVGGFSDSVTVTLAVNPTNGTLLGTKTVAAVGGVATFTDLSIKEAGTGYRLQAAAGTLTPTLSTKFDIMSGPATHLGFTVQPGTTVAGAAIAPAVKVAALDALENPATGFTGSVTVAIGSGTGTSGATLAGITTANSSGGVATFSTLSIDKMGIGYRLAASAASLAAVTSDSFDIVPGVAAQLVFTTQPPTTTIAGAIIGPPVQVEVRDGVGNLVTGFAGNVTISITSGTGTTGATLAGTRTVLASGGVATFTDLSISRSGAAYTLSVRSSGLAGATSTPFDILAGPVSALAFSVQPVTTSAGATFVPAVAVSARDAAGNTVSTFGDPVTLSISANPGNGTLHGTTTQAAVSGVATFPDLSIDSSGTGYRLQAASGALNVTSQAFSIRAGGASRLAFTVQPGTAVAGVAMSPAVQVSELDSLGNVVSGFAGAVTLAITPGSGTGGALLSGTTTVTAAGGVASFSTLSIDSAGTGYTLTASTAGLADEVSATFKVTAGPGSRLAFTVQPKSVKAGAVFSPPLEVTVLDAIGNTATSYAGNVTLSITTGTGTAGANLAGTKTVAVAAGVASFSDLSIDLAGNGYTLSARSSGITGTVSDAFDILIGSLTQVVITQQPATDTAGQILSPVEVTAKDAAGNTVTSFTGNITMSIVVNPSGGTLSGTATKAAVAGVATFSNLSIDKAGTGYRLQAAAGSLKDTSQAFSILAGTATKLAFTQQPTNTTSGASISPSVKVAAQDAFGNTVSSFTGNVTVAITSGTGTAGAVLSGTLTLAANNGVATFSNLSIDKAGTGYTLRATASGLTTATSAAFSISTGGATQLAFTTQPVNTVAGATIPTVKVTVWDGSGNTVTGYSGSVTMAIGTDAGNGTLSGTLVVAVSQGVATFSNLSINHTGVGYTLKASATGLTTAISTPFNITAGQATQLVFTSQPVTTTAATPLAPITVAAKDAQGNTVTGFTSNVTMSIAVNAGAGTLSGTKTVAAVAGVATFSTLSIDSTGTGYRLAATSGSLTPDTSSAFSITAGAATKLVFTVQPSQTGAGGVIAPAVKVTAQDAGGNTATGFTGQVTMAIGTNPSGGILSGTKIVNAVAGVATFADLSIDKLGTGYTLRATATGLTQATSLAFNITAGSA